MATASPKPTRKKTGPKPQTAAQLRAKNAKVDKIRRAEAREAAERERSGSTAPSAQPVQRDYAAVAEQYAREVVAGSIVACKWVIKACARHLNDLQRASSDEQYPFRFDAEQANKFCAQAEKYPHIKGKWANRKERLHLEPWQCFSFCVPFGWLRKTTSKRRFREIYLCVPRKNAKSTMAAAIGNNMLTIDGEHGAEVYSGATSEKQAWEVFGPARLMMLGTPPLLKEHGVEVLARSIVREQDNSCFKPIIGKPGDGASPSCAIVDEYHEHPTSDMVDTMVTGMAAREQPVLLIITTAGTDLAAPCYDKHKEAEKVLDGVLLNEELFAIIYSIDEGDEWSEPAALRKANPNLGVSADEEFLLSQQRQAITNPAYQNRFKTKHLNVWCAAKVAGINMHQWRKCADTSLTLEKFKGQPMWGALDLASKSDVCSFAQLFTKMLPTPVEGPDGRVTTQMQRHYYAFTRNYLPEETIEETGPNQQSYRKWLAQLRLVATPGAEIDFDIVRDDVVAYSKQFAMQEVVYDPWRAAQLAQQLLKEGATMIEMPQNARHMGAAFDEFTTAIKSGRFHHDGDPVLEWMASNVVAKTVIKGLTVPAKEKPMQKIDGIVAIIMAIGRAMVAEPAGGIDGWLRSPVIVSQQQQQRRAA